MSLHFVCILSVLCPLLVQTEQLTCSAGQYLTDNGTCEVCAEGYFMSAANHRNKNCTLCSHHPPQNAEKELDCNSTRDTKYRCDSRSFMTNGVDEPVCHRCTSCEKNGPGYEAQPCTRALDAVCCPQGGMAVVVVKDEACANVSTNSRDYCCVITVTTEPSETTKDQTDKPDVTTDEFMSGLTCGRNMYVDKVNNSCQKCETCFYIDLERHSQEYCDQCVTNATTSRLVYCPARCAPQDVGLKAWERFLISGALVLLAPLAFITLPWIIITYAPTILHHL